MFNVQRSTLKNIAMISTAEIIGQHSETLNMQR